MIPERTFLQGSVILDADCTISLYASGQMGQILRSIPGSVFIADYVFAEEVKWIYNGSRRERKSIDLQPFVDDGLLSIVSLESEAEEMSFIDFAATIGDDGESITGAIAYHRGWAVGTDDRKARTIFSETIPDVQLITTPQFIKYWFEHMNPEADNVYRILQNVRIQAKYEPGKNHSLYAWWQSFNGSHFT